MDTKSLLTWGKSGGIPDERSEPHGIETFGGMQHVFVEEKLHNALTAQATCHRPVTCHICCHRPVTDPMSEPTQVMRFAEVCGLVAEETTDAGHDTGHDTCPLETHGRYRMLSP